MCLNLTSKSRCGFPARRCWPPLTHGLPDHAKRHARAHRGQLGLPNDRGGCVLAVPATHPRTTSETTSRYAARAIRQQRLGAQRALLGATVVNVGCYTLLLTTLMLLPIDAFTENRRIILGIGIVGGIAVVGFIHGPAVGAYFLTGSAKWALITGALSYVTLWCVLVLGDWER